MSIDERVTNTGNLTMALRTAAEFYGTNPVEFWKDKSGKYTNSRTLAELEDLALKFGGSLIDAGVQEGDIVSVLMESNEDFLVAEQGILATGAVIGSLYTNDDPETLVYKINEMESRILIVDNLKLSDKPTQLQRFLLYLNKLPNLETVFVKGQLLDSLPERLNFVRLGDAFERKTEHTDKLNRRIDRIKPDTLARIIYTSGTTGRPKGAMLTHQNLLITMVNTMKVLDHLDSSDRLAVYLPHAHIFGACICNTMILLGAKQYYTHRKTLAQDLPEIKPTLLIGVPKSWEKTITALKKGIEAKLGGLLKVAKRIPFLYDKYDNILSLISTKLALPKAGLDQVQTYIGGGGYHSPYLIEQIELFFGKGKFFLGSGPTESSPVWSVNTKKENRLGSAGKPIPDVDVRIIQYDESVAPENRWESEYETCKPGEVGLVAVKSPGNTKGYFKAPEATRQLFTHDGYLVVGDLGYLDKDGFLYVLGREGDRVKFQDGNFHDLCRIALSLREATALTYIDQVVADGITTKDGSFKTVALVALDYDPNTQAQLAQTLDIKFNNKFFFHPKLVDVVRTEALAAIKALAKQDTNPSDKVSAVLYIEPPSQDNGGITSSFKLKTRFLRNKYHDPLVELANSGEEFMVHNPS